MGIIIEMKSPLKDLETKIREHKRKEQLKLVMTVLTVLAAIISTYFLLEMQTYTNVYVMKNYGQEVTEYGNYEEFAGGVLKYSRDGIVYLNKTGEEQWNQSYQLKNPVIVKSEKAMAASELEGNDIYIFDKDGMNGEVHTPAPIEKMAVADNGIVAALLKSEEAPRVVCYDRGGNVLIEHRASMAGIGYPIGLALSPDGTRLAVSYLAIEGAEQVSKVVFYDFGGNSSGKENYQISEEIYKNVVMPTIYFADDDNVVVVGNHGFVLYKINGSKTSSRVIELEKEITSVFFEGKKIGFVLRKSGTEGQEVRLYNFDGKKVLSRQIAGEYNHVKLSKGNVILFDGKKVCMISAWGVLEFEGEVEHQVMEIISLSGINKYLVMNASGMNEIRLVK